MIDSKKSLFKKLTKYYFRDSVLDIIDIEEAIKKNKHIPKCKDNFIYSSSLNKEIKPISVNLNEYVFEFDNGQIKKSKKAWLNLFFTGGQILANKIL